MADAIGHLRAALADRYRLERELGHGGMAVVYLARDLKHDRDVALKVIKPELAGFVGKDRFAREIKLAARLQHPHICSVYDSGSTPDGQLWYTMPYVAGESLRDRLNRIGRLPVPDAVRIIREAAQALEYAHKQSVIHRDIKPENILLTEDGTTLVADFGIARLVASDSAPGSTAAAVTQLTETGLAIGTPAYMSPEQRFGAPVDVRSDVYSLAATLYELLLGELPASGGGAGLDLFLAQMTDATPRLKLKRPEIGDGLEAVVRKGMSAAPESRFATMGEFSAALESAVSGSYRSEVPARSRRWKPLVAGVAALAVVATGSFGWHRWHALPKHTVVAVVPFNVSPADTVLQDISWSFNEDLRRILMHLPGVGVSTELAVQRMAGGRLTHAEIAKRLGADLVVTTDAARTANGIALTFAVSSPSRSPTVRRSTVSGTLQQLIDWRDSLAGTVMTLAGQRPDPDALKAATQHRIATSVPQAYSEYARVMRLTRADTRQDRASFREVLAREDTLLAFDPRFIDALSDRGMFTLNGMEYYHNEMSADEVAATIKESREFLRRAQAVDPTHPLTERLAGYLLLTSGDTAGAQRAFTAASQAEPVFQLIADLCSVEIDQTPPPAPVPGSCQRLAEADTLNPIAMSFAGYLFANNGRTEEALAAYRRSSRLEPTVARYHVVAAYALRAVQRYDEALQELHQAAALDPRDPEIHHAMFHLLQTIEHPEEALTEARAVVDGQPRDMNSLGELSSVLTGTGHHSESIATSRKAVALSPGNPAAHEALARSLWGAEQFEPALKEFRSAVDLDASQSDRWIGYSSLLRLSGRTAEAQAALDRLKLLSGGPNVYLKANADLMEWIGRADAASEAFRRVVNGDSLRAEHWNSLAYAEILAGRPDSAIVACRRALALDSTRASVYSNLALAMSLTGHGKEAIAASDNLRRYGPYDQAGIAQQIWFYHRGGRQAEAAAKLDSLERRMATYAPSLLPKLIAYTGIGDTARARQTLAETVKRRDLGWREFSLDDPLFAPLRGTPEFLEAKRQFIQQGDRAR